MTPRAIHKAFFLFMKDLPGKTYACLQVIGCDKKVNQNKKVKQKNHYNCSFIIRRNSPQQTDGIFDAYRCKMHTFRTRLFHLCFV